MVLAIHQDEYISVMGLDMQYVESAMGKSGERSKKMIKTDKVIYHTRTQEEYKWLMEQLEKAECLWSSEDSIKDYEAFSTFLSGTCIRMEKKALKSSGLDYYKTVEEYSDYEFIEVSDLMENEKETGALEELEAIHKQVTSQIEDLRKQGKEPKAIEYTIKVCFE